MHSPCWPSCSTPTAIALASAARASSTWPASTSPATATTSTWSTSARSPGSTSPCRRRDGARVGRMHGPGQDRSARRTSWRRHLQQHLAAGPGPVVRGADALALLAILQHADGNRAGQRRACIEHLASINVAGDGRNAADRRRYRFPGSTSPCRRHDGARAGRMHGPGQRQRSQPRPQHRPGRRPHAPQDPHRRAGARVGRMHGPDQDRSAPPCT